MKYYFETVDSELCYKKKHFIELMKERGITSLQVYPAIMMKGEKYFFCTKNNECGVTGESCGKQCESYIPRNGKNGRCRFSANCYEPSDEPVILTINPKILKNGKQGTQ